MTAISQAAEPCAFGPCGQPGARLYPEGWRCDPHSPWARAGLAAPDAKRYCLAICYCGRCPHRRRAVAPITPTVVDIRAVASGKRRSSPAEYRDALRAQQERTA